MVILDKSINKIHLSSRSQSSIRLLAVPIVLLSVLLLFALFATMIRNEQNVISETSGMEPGHATMIENSDFYFTQEIPSLENLHHTGNGNTRRYKLFDKGTSAPVTFYTAMAAMESPDSQLSGLLIHVLKNNDIQAYFWECPPITNETIQLVQFEFVLIPSSALASKSPDRETFMSHFLSSKDGVCVFESLGCDHSTLIAPFPLHAMDIKSYTHLAAFVRMSPEEQVKKIITTVASELLHKVKASHPTNPIWLSTSGLGVYWLHVRLDTFPKYYNWMEYKHV